VKEMKKNIILLFVFILTGMFSLSAYATQESMIREQYEIQARINKIGYRLLNSARIENRATFQYNGKNIVGTNTKSGLFQPRRITIYRGILTHCESDDEIAAVLAHEISHIDDSYKGVFRGSLHGYTKSYSPRKYVYKADKRAVDFMADAGYDPLALIVILNKISDQYRFEITGTPFASKRMVAIYEYIYRNYPVYLAKNSYKNNVFYQNFLLTSATQRAKLQEKLKDEGIIPVSNQKGR